MKCPLTKSRPPILASKNGTLTSSYDCWQEECAWWDNEADVCSVFEISWNLRHIRHILIKGKE